MMKTYSVKESEIEHKWHVIDASGKILGKVASDAARLLMGKHKVIFTRNLDTGDYVVIINADKIIVTGNKEKKKLYYSHSGYPGGLKVTNMEKLTDKHPTAVVERAIAGMLPHNRLGAQMLKKLRVYTGDSHPHQAQAGVPAVKKETDAQA
jgi:large subunit ribosomal protein L13